MANYKHVTDFLNDLRAIPGEENIVSDGTQLKLKQEYAIERMNDIYGMGNWSIKEVKNELQKSTKNNTAQNICAMTVEYKHPISGQMLTTQGTAPMNFAADDSVMENAFLSAISRLGVTFGEALNFKQPALLTEIPKQKLAAVI